MEEQIEKERASLREGKMYYEGFSYLSLFLGKKKQKEKVKLSKLGTVNVLIYLEESFLKCDSYVLGNLDKITKELLSRSDLFISVLKYLENKKVRDDLYYWMPKDVNVNTKTQNLATKEPTSIFSFIVSLLPNFPQMYKSYFTESVICGRSFFDAFNFIHEKFPNEFENFSLMILDLKMFKHCISDHAWVDNFNKKQISEQTLHLLESPAYLNISDDIEAIICPEVSFVDISIGNKSFVVSVSHLNGLMTKDLACKPWWLANGLSEDEWNLI